MTIANTLTLSAGSIMNFTLTPTLSTPSASNGNDQVVMTGNNLLTIGASGTVNISAPSGLSLGNYVLISNIGGTISGGPGWTPVVTGDSGHSYILGAQGTNFDLTVSGLPVTWTNFTTNSTWDLTSANWTPSGTGKYIDGDPVTFDNTPGASQIITLNGATFSPASMTFNNTLAFSYTFNNGTIAGTGPLVLTSTGTVRLLNNTNTFTGGTSINGGGTLNIGATGTYSSTTIAVSASGSQFNVASGATLASGASLTLSTGGAVTFNNSSDTLSGLTSDSTGTVMLNGTAMDIYRRRRDNGRHDQRGTGSLRDFAERRPSAATTRTLAAQRSIRVR